MITLTRAAGQTAYRTAEYVGLSTDTKPTVANNGDVFIEMDTQKKYYYNESGSAWVTLPTEE